MLVGWQALLKDHKFTYVLDMACVQFEPDNPEYIRVSLWVCHCVCVCHCVWVGGCGGVGVSVSVCPSCGVTSPAL